MVNLKCKKLFKKGKDDLRCIEKGKDLTNCNKDCKDMVMSYAWKQLLYCCDPDYRKMVQEQERKQLLSYESNKEV